MHRSGTSALTRTLNLLGAALPRHVMSAVANNNPKGFWEPQEVYEFNEKLLRTLKSRWDDWRALPVPDADEPSDLIEEQTQILRDNFNGQNLYVLKDPRLCRLLPWWDAAFASANTQIRTLIALRNPIEVAESLARRDGFSLNRGLLLWLRHMLDADWVSRNRPRCVIHFPSLLENWRAQAAHIATELDIRWPVAPDAAAAEIGAFLDRDDRHFSHSTQDVNSNPQVFEWVRQAYAALLDMTAGAGNAEAIQTLDRVRSEFDHACNIFGPDWFDAATQASDATKQADFVQHQNAKLQTQIKEWGDERTRLHTQLKQAETEAALARKHLDDAQNQLTTAHRHAESLRETAEEHKKARASAERRLKENSRLHQVTKAALQTTASQALHLVAKQLEHTANGAASRSTLSGWGKALSKVRNQTPLASTASRIRASGLFDSNWYVLQYPDVARAGKNPLGHWLKTGWRERRLPSPYFDPDWYLTRYADVREAGINPLYHYLTFGWREGRQPGPAFDPLYYLEKAPDVATAGTEPLTHYVARGRMENRPCSPWFDAAWFASAHAINTADAYALFELTRHLPAISPTPYFDPLWYLGNYSDLSQAQIAPFEHFLAHGAAEGRSPNAYFDSGWFAERHPEAADNPLLFFLRHPNRASLDTSPLFSATTYLRRYPEVAESDIEPLRHFLTVGRDEGRDASPSSKGAVFRPRAKTTHSRASAARPLTSEALTQAQKIVAAHTHGKKFSVILPTWNRRESLLRAIRSVQSQSYDNWELIICDDGSTDSTGEMVQTHFADELSSGKINYLPLPHGGVCAARNAGLERATGDWIAYLDSDNQWRPEYLLMTAAAFLSEPQCRTHYAGLAVTDELQDRTFDRCIEFDWHEVLRQNFIDLNIFAHHRGLYLQLGGFDESLSRLVDWDLILRFTRLYPPSFSPFVLANYFLSRGLDNITHREPLAPNENAVRSKFAINAVAQEADLRLAYVLWDWPALSQTFVMEELKELLRRKIDVRVYFHTTPDRALSQPPSIPATQVTSHEQLAECLLEDQRNWIHSHFAYPAVTRLTWPAAEQTGIPFSFMPHAVDIFHKANRGRNRIGEVANSPMCGRVMVHGEFHRNFLLERGVPSGKFSLTPQAIDLNPWLTSSSANRTRGAQAPLRIVCMARLIEKKGVADLLTAIAQCETPVELKVFGYGPLLGELEQLRDSLKLQGQVDFAGGYEGASESLAILKQSDLFCLPCVEAENGDLDGMPTVIFEAMAAGVPVLTTPVAAIPEFVTHGVNGFLSPPRDPEKLAATIDRIANTSLSELAAVVNEARARVRTQASSAKTVDTLLDSACRPPLDIFMVSFHRDGYGNWPATERAIRSVLTLTTTPFRLTIVDNASSPEAIAQLQAIAAEDERIRLIPLDNNVFCGPASNIALDLAESDVAIYVCSNEGLILKRGWERQVLDAMRAHPNAALGGHLVASPKWHDGESYARQPWFGSFRNPDFARDNPKRSFWHVQGGLFAINMRVYRDEGGFSPERPQDLMDVELSYYYESRGYDLLQIPGLVALSNKTRPTIESLVDETTFAVHPVFEPELPMLRSCQDTLEQRCNLCGWIGRAATDATSVAFDCPDCGSTANERQLYRALASSNLHHRGLALPIDLNGSKIREKLQDMFSEEAGAEVADLDALAPGRASQTLGLPPNSPERDPD